FSFAFAAGSHRGGHVRVHRNRRHIERGPKPRGGTSKLPTPEPLQQERRRAPVLALVVSFPTLTGTVLLVLRVTSFIGTEEPHVFSALDLGDATRGRGIRAKGNAVVGDGFGDRTAGRARSSLALIGATGLFVGQLQEHALRAPFAADAGSTERSVLKTRRRSGVGPP